MPNSSSPTVQKDSIRIVLKKQPPNTWGFPWYADIVMLLEIDIRDNPGENTGHLEGVHLPNSMCFVSEPALSKLMWLSTEMVGDLLCEKRGIYRPQETHRRVLELCQRQI